MNGILGSCPFSAVVYDGTFFELRAADRGDVAALDQFREMSFKRSFYGGVILRGEGLAENDTAIVGAATSAQPMEPFVWRPIRFF